MKVSVSGLYIYPVKSLRGIPITEATLCSTGLKWDRHWMVINPDDRFVTQRQLPQMVLIHTAIADDHLVLSKEGMHDLKIDLTANKQAEPFIARVWKDPCQVIDEGEIASQWLTEAIGAPKKLRLVRQATGHPRPQSKPNLLGPDTTTKFADAAPYLICSQQSLDAINQSLIQHQLEPVTIEHFRPNILITGVDAFGEHNIVTLEHPQYSLKHCYPCQRCIIPTINITTGERHPKQQPFTLITELNSMPYDSRAPAFGENAILLNGENNTISIGDTLNATSENIDP